MHHPVFVVKIKKTSLLAGNDINCEFEMTLTFHVIVNFQIVCCEVFILTIAMTLSGTKIGR